MTNKNDSNPKKASTEGVETLKDYGLEVGRITKIDLSANGSLEVLVLAARMITDSSLD